MTSRQQAPDLLQEGIGAAKAGDTERARKLLVQVVESDRGCRLGWLWLSDVLNSDDERRLCLENILTLTEAEAHDPVRKAAQRGLARLGATPNLEPKAGREITVRRHYEPISTAAAILYPESQVREWRWRDLPEHQAAPIVEYQTDSSFDDVWSREVDMCAYCAEELEWEAERCPRCGRGLFETVFVYKRPTINLVMLFSLLVLVGVQFLVLLAANMTERTGALPIGLHAAVVVGIAGTAVGVYQRKPWAYTAVLVFLPSAFLVALSNRGIADTFGGLVAGRLLKGEGGFPNDRLLELLPLLLVVSSFLLAVVRVGPDFVRAKEWLTARVDKGLKWAPDFYHAGRRYAGRQMWATAILHWQRAAAHEPRRVYYQQILGEAYARLGFFERSLDLLRSALRLAEDPMAKDELRAMIDSVQREALAGRPRPGDA